MYKIALIGGGQIAEAHLNALRRSGRSQACAVAELRQERLQQLSSDYGIEGYADYKTMVAEQKPDLVIIALPHYLHRDTAVWCAAQGCHLLVEKPMAITSEDCRKMNAAARASGVRLAVGHVQRFFEANRIAKEIVSSGDLGELIMVRDRRWGRYFLETRPAWFLEKAKSGGGVIVNLGSHSIDRIQYVTGSQLVKMKAHLTFLGNRGDVEGSASLLSETAEGIPVHISLTGYGGAAANETELLFAKGSLSIRPSEGVTMYKDGRQEEFLRSAGQEGPFALQLDHVLDAIEARTALSISGDYGQQVFELVEAAYESFASGEERRPTRERVQEQGLSYAAKLNR